MKTKVLFISMMTMFCFWDCSDKNNVIDEPEIPLQIEPKPEIPNEPETRHSYKPVQLNNTQQAINTKLQEFSWKLFKEVYVNREKDTNLMISPISLEVDLGMFINGLEGETLQEVLKTLGLEDYSKEQINDFFKNMMEGIEKADEAAIFKSANAFWYNQHYTANNDYLTAISTNYAAKAEAVNYSDPQTVTKINAWCAEQTNDRIKKILEKTSEDDIFHLMNAVYFKAGWEKEFDKNVTTKKTFHYANGVTAEVDMMAQSYMTTYAETDLYQLCTKSFVDDSFQMVLILPKEGVKIEDAIPAALDINVSASATADGYPGKPEIRQVALSAPKFTSEYTENRLFNYLKNINPTLELDWHDLCMFEAKFEMGFEAMQKTFFLMDEEGAEAAAITTIHGCTTSGPDPDMVYMTLNRPFFYAIVESNTQCPLFIGYYGN